MATHSLKVRAGFTVILGGPNANHPSAVVYAAGQTVVLTDAQVLSHLHKLEPTDTDSSTKLSSLLGSLWKPTENVV